MKLRFKSDERGVHAYENGKLFVYDRNYNPESIPLDEPIQVMITGGLPNHPNGFIVRKPAETDRLVHHRGFVQSGHGQVFASSTAEIGNKTVVCMLHPGSVIHIVPIFGRPSQDFGRPIPGRIWVSERGNQGLGIPALTEQIVNTQEETVYQRMVDARS